MFRLWGKLWRDNHLLQDITICDDAQDKNRTKKVFDALEEICYAFDLGQPIWLESNIRDFKRRDKTRFTKDSFVEEIEFDYLEIQVLEED
ncbi:MAG: hypothetical protein J1E62_03875 [Lachnospiraceae bacterium]|nr:hypothetical protein [Lachnospiraceae bacterium]